jgi:hypothetical protein
MAAINAKVTSRDKTATSKILRFRGTADAGLTIATGDTLTLNMKKVFEVITNKPALMTGWSYNEATKVLTFTVTGGPATAVFVTVVGRA